MGTIPSKGATSYRPGKANQTIAAGQYLSGTQTIQGDANLTAANIRQGATIFGVAGGYGPESYWAATPAHFYGQLDETVEVNAPNARCRVAALVAGNDYYTTARITLWGWNGTGWVEVAKSEDATGTEGRDSNTQIVAAYEGYSRYRLNLYCNNDKRVLGIGCLQGY